MTVIDTFPRLHSTSVRYAISVCVVLATTAGCFFSKEVLDFPYLLSFLAAIAISTLLGPGPGVVAFVLATLLSDFFFIPPVLSLSLNHITWSTSAIYGVTVLVILYTDRFPIYKGLDQKLKLALVLLLDNFVGVWNPTNNDKSHLLGRLDGEVEGEIFGWALNAIDPFVAPKITVYVESRPVGEVHPVYYRPDVGSHCFYFDLSRCCPLMPRARVETRFSDGRLLSNSPLLVNIPPARPVPHSETILFMHIAKTAGTAFREAVLENYKQSEVAYLYPDAPGFLSDNLAVLPLEQRARFLLVFGHFEYGIHQLLPQPSTYVTLVREPVARVVSQFRYLMQKQPDNGEAKTSPAHLVELLEQCKSVTLDNHMVRCFSGVSEKDFPPGRIDRQVYELAVHNLKTAFSFVGYQENCSEAYSVLQQRFEWKSRPLDVVNKTSFAPGTDYDSVRATIEQFNRWDCQLYNEIRHIFPSGRSVAQAFRGGASEIPAAL